MSTREWELVERVLPFFQRWRWQGPAEVEFKVDCRDNEPKVIEINPRFPGYIGLLIKCGVDFPTMVCELCCELEVSYKKYPDSAVGVKYLDPVCYAKLAIEDLIKSKKRRTISQVLSELRGKNVTNNGERSDWLVILAKLMTKHKTVTDRSLLDVWY